MNLTPAEREALENIMKSGWHTDPLTAVNTFIWCYYDRLARPQHDNNPVWSLAKKLAGQS